MRKKIFIVFIAIIIFVAYALYGAFFDIKGELISETESPNEIYKIKVYLINGGATSSYAIRGELNYNKSKKKPKNIYWDYPEEEARIQWVDDDTVLINGIKLSLPNEKYDWRREK